MIDIRPLKRSVVLKLFDSLVLPVASYGCQVWFAEKWLVKNSTELNLGEGRKTSNAAVWCDPGRYPLVIKISKQVFSYFNRLKSSTSEDGCLVKYAFNEQKSLNMSWNRRINSLQVFLQTHSNFTLQTELPKPTKIEAYG